MEIKLSELLEVSEIIFDQITKAGFDRIEISGINRYWTISVNGPGDFSTTSPKKCVGFLGDDWKELEKVLCEDVVPAPIDFERLGDLIRFVGDTISKINQDCDPGVSTEWDLIPNNIKEAVVEGGGEKLELQLAKLNRSVDIVCGADDSSDR